MTDILILYYSSTGHVKRLANAISEGVDAEGVVSRIRTVPAIRADFAETNGDSFENADGQIYVTKDDLSECGGLALGSPARFGTMAAPLKSFFETTSDLWLSGAMVDKPACVFGSASSLHGGHEGLLQSMMIPLIHHGMVVMGCPYTEPGLNAFTGGGTPYGPTHLDAENLSNSEIELAQNIGRRLARWVNKI